jgi:all-trans-retinol 13,14-reductase
MTDQKNGQWDAIVIGSGMGGMAAAAALSKVGHKVLLLEQYRTIGGLSHSFTIEGFSWDAGIHYLNHVAPEDRERHILDWLSDSPIEMASIGTIYDNLHIGDAPPWPCPAPTRRRRAISRTGSRRGGSHRCMDRRAEGGPGRDP